MKPAPFNYLRPESLDEACHMLSQDSAALPIAGGQTLIPMLAMRLARPSALVDLAHIPALAYINGAHGAVEIGAMTRQAAAEASPVIAEALPLMRRVLPWVGHAATRVRGTIGGSISNADPAAEIPLVAVTLGAQVVVATAQGIECIAAADFFVAAMVTSLPMGGLVTAIKFPPVSGARIGTGFAEVNARSSDFAFAAVATQIELDEQGLARRIMIGVGGVADVPIRLDLNAWVGKPPQAAQILEDACGQIADLDAFSDLHASAAYRVRAAVALTRRSLTQALQDASRMTAC